MKYFKFALLKVSSILNSSKNGRNQFKNLKFYKMKKLKLSLANMQATEVLSREQLKKIIGGEEGSGGAAGACDETILCGHDWDQKTMSFSIPVKCSNLPPVGNLPGSCTCLAGSKDGTSCSA
jgi:hypothetical protein